MRRTPRRPLDPAYPTVDAALDRRSVLVGLGALAGASLMAPLAGCPVTGGGIVEGPDDSHVVRLPLSDQTRTLYFDHGSIEYHLLASVADLDRAMYLQAHVDTVMTGVDDALSAHDVTAYAPDAGLGAIEETLRHVLADLYEGQQGAAIDDWYAVELLIDAYDEGEEMLGDVAEPE